MKRGGGSDQNTYRYTSNGRNNQNNDFKDDEDLWENYEQEHNGAYKGATWCAQEKAEASNAQYSQNNMRRFNRGVETGYGDEPRSLSDQRKFARQIANAGPNRYRNNNQRGYYRGKKYYNKQRGAGNISYNESVSSCSSSRGSSRSDVLQQNRSINEVADDVNYFREENVNNSIPNRNTVQSKLSQIELLQQQMGDCLKDISPPEVIMNCRQEIDDLTKECTSKKYRTMNEIRSEIPHTAFPQTLQLHLENLSLQLHQFDQYITKKKQQLSPLLDKNVVEILKEVEVIKAEVRRECTIFKRSFPSYGYKSDIIDKLRDNQVVILQADFSYYLNAMVPIFLRNEFPDHVLFCCEAANVLCRRLQENVESLIDSEGEKIINTDDSIKSMNFMTEETMLNLFNNINPLGDKDTISILNLPLKRSINMDLVLANLRDNLIMEAEREGNSKLLLLTSSKDSTSKYQNYFSTEFPNGVGIIEMKPLSYPVQTVWKDAQRMPLDDYIGEVIRTCIAIHVLNGEGNIMAFLPTISDAKKAIIELNKEKAKCRIKDLDCDLIHEDSLFKPCLGLSAKMSRNRIVYFVTECAEMFVIPSVYYVVDCGLRKDYLYDTSKKLDLLTTTFVSSSKARLRKNLAGTFSSGVCYRLYSKDNYCNEMPSREYPELLTVNPFNTLIKIFQHKPEAVASVFFVESLSKNTEDYALKLLRKYNAVKDGALTELGKNIVKLPYPTRYSKLILVGIQWGLAYEAVVLVAFSSVKGRVFQFFEDPDAQRSVDAVKLEMVQQDSDTFTYLHIYKLWLANDCSSVWCEEHFINFMTLKSVHEKVEAISQLIGEVMKENVLPEFAKDRSESLIELLFECFKDNLCVNTGHYKSGYRVLSSKCIAFVHPSSVLCQTDNLPQFILFDQMSSTSRDFLLTITAIPDHLIMTSLTENNLEFDYSDMFEKSLLQQCIEPVGERMIKQVLLGNKGKKLKEIEKSVQEKLNSESVVIEPLPEMGRVLVFALPSYIDEAVNLVKEIINTKSLEIINSEQSHILELKRGQIKIPIEIKWLKGAIACSVKAGSFNRDSDRIQNNLEDAEAAIETAPNVIQRSICLSWIRRECSGMGTVSFEPSDFMRARKLALKFVHLLGKEVYVQVSKFEDNQLYITQIPPEAKSSHLEDAFRNVLPGVTFTKVNLRYEGVFETSPNELQEIKDKIVDICEKDGYFSDFTVVIPAPKPSATIMKAYINVGEKDGIEKAADEMSKMSINDKKITAKPVYRSVIKCHLEVCMALRERFKERLELYANELHKLSKDEEPFKFDIAGVEGMAAIKMVSNNHRVLVQLQRIVNDLLEGEVLNKSFSKKLSKLFCHGGHMWLKALQNLANVHIVEDFKSKSLRLYGSRPDCERAMKRIMEFLKDTENEAVKLISLASDRNNRSLLKAIIREYGANLEKFIETCSLQFAVLDIKSCSLSLHGNRECIERAETCLRNLAESIAGQMDYDVTSNEETCPVCASSALNLTIRLEVCGHLYCSECIQVLVEQAQFPIQCCAVECHKEIVLDDICKVLGDDPDQLNTLLEKSMKYFLNERRTDIYYCPAPDCDMFFYKREIVADRLGCPLCQNDICVKCNVVFHQGFTCDVYQGSKNDPDYSFKAWSKDIAECKQCPKCHTAIERTGGCDHMTCGNCRSHFCWVCVTEFPDKEAVYGHLPFCNQHPKW